MGESSDEERQTAETELVQAIYPDEITCNEKTSEIHYEDDVGSLALRLESNYPSVSKPTVVSAQLRITNKDLREDVRKHIVTLPAGEELLDLIITAFKDMATSAAAEVQGQKAGSNRSASSEQEKATTVIWLHHLLATSKRKLATQPPSSVSGITKPGYPGVMIFSGPKHAVQEHVAQLRSLNWQAFQIRLEVEEQWSFTHGGGTREVENMGEVVNAVESKHREELMAALKIKG